MEMEIKNIAPVRVVYLRHVGPYEQCGQAWERLCAWAGPKGLLTPKTRFYGVCHDDPKVTPPDKVRLDVCCTVEAAVEPEGEFGVMDIFGDEYATTVYQGPYAGLQGAYETLFGVALPQAGREYAEGPSVECYVNDPQTTPPDELLTEINIPLK